MLVKKPRSLTGFVNCETCASSLMKNCLCTSEEKHVRVKSGYVCSWIHTHAGLVAESVRFAPDYFLADLLVLYNNVLFTGGVPASWKIRQIMTPKFQSARNTTDFKPITLLPVPVLEACQPEGQHRHGFRFDYHLEKHLIIANDKLLALNVPIWVISLDVRKAFDIADWNILSPRLFTSNVQWAMEKWRSKVEQQGLGIDLRNGMPPLLDLRFADEVVLFASTADEYKFLLDCIVLELEYVGVLLHSDKPVIVTKETRPPFF